MAAIRSSDTKPELLIRKSLHARGYRYRLHDRQLPGRPDIVLPKYNAAIFVHGCFWHGHDCHLFKWPKTRSEFWRKKISDNTLRDRIAMTELEARDWRIGIVWECALRGTRRIQPDQLIQNIDDWLRSEKPRLQIASI